MFVSFWEMEKTPAQMHPTVSQWLNGFVVLSVSPQWHSLFTRFPKIDRQPPLKARNPQQKAKGDERDEVYNYSHQKLHKQWTFFSGSKTLVHCLSYKTHCGMGWIAHWMDFYQQTLVSKEKAWHFHPTSLPKGIDLSLVVPIHGQSRWASARSQMVFLSFWVWCLHNFSPVAKEMSFSGMKYWGKQSKNWSFWCLCKSGCFLLGWILGYH